MTGSTVLRYLVSGDPTDLSIWPGDDYPVGATLAPLGVNFAVYSSVADFVELCLFDEAGEERRIRLPDKTGSIHHGFVPGIGAGQAYGYRVHGPWDPGAGLRCNPAKLLLDPYAKAIAGEPNQDRTVFGHRQAAPNTLSSSDSAPAMSRSVVVDTAFDWEEDAPPNVPLHCRLPPERH